MRDEKKTRKELKAHQEGRFKNAHKNTGRQKSVTALSYDKFAHVYLFLLARACVSVRACVCVRVRACVRVRVWKYTEQKNTKLDVISSRPHNKFPNHSVRKLPFTSAPSIFIQNAHKLPFSHTQDIETAILRFR